MKMDDFTDTWIAVPYTSDKANQQLIHMIRRIESILLIRMISVKPQILGINGMCTNLRTSELRRAH